MHSDISCVIRKYSLTTFDSVYIIIVLCIHRGELMKVNVSRIMKNQGSFKEFEGNTELSPFEFSGENINVISPVVVKGRIENAGDNLKVSGLFKSKLKLRCSRCLEYFDYFMEGEFDEELSNKKDNEDTIHFEGESIDLSPIIVNNILLNLPIKIVCSNDCKGLCPHCGKNNNIEECQCTQENVDPRLSVLKDFLKGS